MDIGVPLLELGKFNVEPLMHDIIAKHYPPGVRLFAQMAAGVFPLFFGTVCSGIRASQIGSRLN